jgi:hypothetical protein
MFRRAVLILCSVWAASPALAMRAPDYLDADQRMTVTLPSEQITPVITVVPQLQAAEAEEAAQLPTRQQAQVAATQQIASPVPEPSGLVMLGLGLLLLLLKPYKRDGEAIADDPERYSTLQLRRGATPSSAPCRRTPGSSR